MRSVELCYWLGSIVIHIIPVKLVPFLPNGKKKISWLCFCLSFNPDCLIWRTWINGTVIPLRFHPRSSAVAGVIRCGDDSQQRGRTGV